MNAILIHMVRGALEAKPIQVDTDPTSLLIPVGRDDGFAQAICPRQTLVLESGRLVACYVQHGIAPEVAVQAAMTVVHQLATVH